MYIFEYYSTRVLLKDNFLFESIIEGEYYLITLSESNMGVEYYLITLIEFIIGVEHYL